MLSLAYFIEVNKLLLQVLKIKNKKNDKNPLNMTTSHKVMDINFNSIKSNYQT